MMRKKGTHHRVRTLLILSFLAVTSLVFYVSFKLEVAALVEGDTRPNTAPASLPPTRGNLVPPRRHNGLYFDENLTRAGEMPISMAEYFDCLDARLNVDHRTQTERPFTSVNTTIPYLVLPVTVEQGDMKALMCNLTVQVRHVMYVQNGGVGSMTAFLDRVQAAFAFTARLKVHRMPHNYGYAVALNVAMRDALALPFDEVPFFMMANNDVRMPVGMLEDGLPQMYERSLAGRARVAELEAEVATEPNEHTPVRFRAVPLRSTDDRHVLVTSRLLPDRIRYMSKDQRRAAFAEYHGALYVDKTDQTAFWGLTRLAMEVTGFFDENCYPAYYEDTDYLRRMWLLGFKIFQVAGWERSPMHHIGSGAILGVGAFAPAAELSDIPPFIRGSSYVIRRQFGASYTFAKYGLQGVSWPDPEKREPFMRDQLPLDVFVLNEQRNAAISELQRVAVMLEGTPDLKLEWSVRSAGNWLARHNASLNIALGSYIGNGLTYYRDGNALRLLPSLDSYNIALKVLQNKATTTTTTTAAPETREPLYFDRNLTRAGEMPISMAEYFDCLDARLNVDHRTQTERPFTSVNTTIPYLVLPVTVEQGDMKALMCNLTVQVRHVMYVQNGGVGSMTAFLDRVQAAFAFTARLKVHRMPHNYGYAVALNVAMRDALALPFDEVPFFMMANNDVRMPVGMLEDGLPQMYERSLAGRARVAELEAEVATEPNEHTPVRFRAVPLRSTDDRHVLVTSRLLPDRIRYMSKDQRRAAFAEYHGALYVDKTDQTAFWGLTRLAMEVTGFFDENCYPAYYEDTDYLRRMWLLGFKIFQVAGWERSPMHHIGSGAILAVQPFEAAPELEDVYPFIRGSAYVFQLGLSHAYTQRKYGLQGVVWPDKESKEPFMRDQLPLDAFVVDTHRNAAIAELQRLSVHFHGVVDPGVALGEREPLLLLKKKNEFLYNKIYELNMGGALHYRDGNELRLSPSVP